MNLWLLAPRCRADAVACVPTIESSLTPVGAAAVDRARTSLDHLRLSQLSCTCLHVHKSNQVTILLPFRHRAHDGQGAALAHVPVGTHMSSARKVKAFLLGFVPQRKPAHTPMLEDRCADDVLSHRRPSTLVAKRVVSQNGKLEP
jgi:hypothetical protein